VCDLKRRLADVRAAADAAAAELDAAKREREAAEQELRGSQAQAAIAAATIQALEVSPRLASPRNRRFTSLANARYRKPNYIGAFRRRSRVSRRRSRRRGLIWTRSRLGLRNSQRTRVLCCCNVKSKYVYLDVWFELELAGMCSRCLMNFLQKSKEDSER
jgi:hypothetical protein